MSRIFDTNEENIVRAAQALRDGKLVAFPTETVYGLGADATNGQAIAAIYAAKGRPSFNPLIIHVADTSQLEELIVWNAEAKKLAAAFWPGPITLILPRKKGAAVSLLASSGLDTLAVRIPAHPDALRLLRATGLPIAAPSANASGKLSPTTPEHVQESLGSAADMILAGGRSHIGIESTVVDLTSSAPVILRPGDVLPEQIEQTLERKVAFFHPDATCAQTIRSPGMLTSHYAPHLPVRIDAISVGENEALLAFGFDENVKGGASRLNLSPRGDLKEAAANLFSMLRILDNPHYAGIAVMPVPDTGLGIAINDRLRRAAAQR